MINTWFKIFFRNSKKNWLNILINVLGLTLGFAGLLIVLLYLKDEESYNENNPIKDNIYRVIHKISHVDGYWYNSTDIEGEVYRDQLPEIEDFYLSKEDYEETVIHYEGKTFYTNKILKGEPNFFNFFPFEITNGTVAEFEKARNNIALSKECAKTLFGDDSAVGKTIELYGRTFMVTTVYKVTGKHYVMPKVIYQYREKPKGGWGSFNRILFVKSNQDLNTVEFEKKIQKVWTDIAIPTMVEGGQLNVDAFIEKYGVLKTFFEPLSDIRLKTPAKNAGPEGKGFYELILILLLLSILLIVISSVNVINLSIASVTQRAKEVGIKKTLGLSKITIAMQYCIEVICQGIIAFVLAILLVELLLPFFNDFMDKDISILNPSLLLKIGFFSLLLSLFIGSVPAIYLSNFKSVAVLKGNVSRGKQGIMIRNIMLGLQFLISGFFLIGAIVISKQVGYMLNKDLGFNGDQVVVIPFHYGKNKFAKYELAKKELTKHSNIEAVTSNSFLIGGEGDENSSTLDFKDNKVILAHINAIDYNYLEVMGVDIVKGRGFDPLIASDTIANILVNESFVKELNIYDDPLGQIVNTDIEADDNVRLKIIGVVKDYHVRGLNSIIPSTMYTHWNANNWYRPKISTVQLKIKANNIDETLAYVENYWNENVEVGYPFNPSFVNERFAKTYKEYQNQKTLFFILTSVVVLMSLLGLFALATLTIQQRLKEVAIRKTLGASTKEIIFPLIKNFIVITIISSIVLIPLAYYLAQIWLNNFVYRIDMPVLPYIVTPILLIVLVFAVVGVKAFNATKLDLIKYLKYE